MIKLKKIATFDPNSNRMKVIADVEKAIKEFKNKKNKNLDYLLKNRFSWMKKFINTEDKGLEVGAGAGFSKNYIKNKNFKISDFAMHDHLDLKNLDAQNTKFDANSYDFVIAVNMLHHVPYPMKFLNEMFKILKPGGKLIIQEAHCSVVFQIITIIMRHEGFDFTKNVWDESSPATDEKDLWSGNSAIPYLLFDNNERFNSILGNKFEIKYKKLCECLLFLNSGGVTSKTFYIPFNFFILKIISYLDNFLSFLLPGIFALGYKIVLIKK